MASDLFLFTPYSSCEGKLEFDSLKGVLRESLSRKSPRSLSPGLKPSRCGKTPTSETIFDRCLFMFILFRQCVPAEGAAVVCSSLSSRHSALDEGTKCFMLPRPFLHGERDSEIACMMMMMMMVIFSAFSAVNCRSVRRKHPSHTH